MRKAMAASERKIELLFSPDVKKQLKLICVNRNETMAKYIKTAIKDRLQRDGEYELAKLVS